MEKQFSSILGAGLGLLSLSGFMKHRYPKYFLGLMNVDSQHSVLRIPFTAALLYAGSKRLPLKDTRAILSFVGLFYLAMGMAGAVDRSIGRTLPSRLTNVDMVYHFSVGAIALWLGQRSGRMMK